MEDIITQVLQKQFLGYDVLELENRSLQKLEEMVLYDVIRLKEIPRSRAFPPSMRSRQRSPWGVEEAEMLCTST